MKRLLWFTFWLAWSLISAAICGPSSPHPPAARTAASVGNPIAILHDSGESAHYASRSLSEPHVLFLVYWELP